MTKLLRCKAALLMKLAVTGLVFCCFVQAQILNQDVEIQVRDLPALTARTHDPSDVLLTSLDTLIHDSEVCCGKDSALEDSALAADPKSLKDVASKLDGRHLLSDGRPTMVKATYMPGSGVTAGDLINAIMNQHAALIELDSSLYVVHGVVYMWMANYNPEGGGSTAAVVHKLLLWDTRCSDSRRSIVVNRDTDDMRKLQGLLLVEVKPQ